ncbi:MAG: carotenoid biosynthesis protein, partial [Halobacteriota archaeon]
MVSKRTFAASTVVLGIGTVVHAIFTWPWGATIALFIGGAIVAFLAEAFVVNLGWLEHHVGPRVAGVPLYLLFGWVGTIYVAFRVVLFLTDGWAAIVAAA